MEFKYFSYLLRHKRTVIIKNNIIKSLYLKVASLLIELYLISLILSYVGSLKFGIILIMFSLLNWFGILDFGIGNALRNKIGKSLVQKKNKLVKKLISTCYALSALISIAFFVCYLSINPFLSWAKILSTKEILDKFPNTLILAVAAMTVAVLIGGSRGMVACLVPGSWIDKTIMVLALTGVSAPVFWTGLIFVLVFGVYLGWLPPTGYGGVEYLILPAFTLGLRSAAQITRLTRSAMMDTLGQDYIRTARSKELPWWKILLKHALPNSLIPVLTVIGTDFGSYLSGAVLTESIFGWPGLGRLTLEAILKRDLPIIQGTVLFMALMFICVNLVVDILYGIIDPRIRAERSN